MTALRWAAGIAIGFAIFLGGYIGGCAIYALTHTAETPPARIVTCLQAGETFGCKE